MSVFDSYSLWLCLLPVGVSSVQTRKAAKPKGDLESSGAKDAEGNQREVGAEEDSGEVVILLEYQSMYSQN